jgi:hypothetical protein
MAKGRRAQASRPREVRKPARTSRWTGMRLLGQPLEPRLLPKLRLHFADFPWLHCSIDQRLLAQETCCGSWYGRATRECCPGFSVGNTNLPHSVVARCCPGCMDHLRSIDSLPWSSEPINKKRELFTGVRAAVPRFVAGLPGLSQWPGIGMLADLPFTDSKEHGPRPASQTLCIEQGRRCRAA